MKLKLAIGAVALAAAIVATLPELRPGLLALAGRGQGCPVSHALRISREKQALTASKDRILRDSSLLETDPAGFEHWETPYGRYWIPRGQKYILPFNLAEMETRIYGSGAHYVQPGDTVLDCGANVGTFARFALEAGAGKVVAIEPSPENLECLRRNFKSEIEGGRVVVVAKGVWHRQDTLELLVDPDNRAADSFVMEREASTGAVRVPLVTIDQLAEDLALARVDFIKMDIEGAETNALRGAAQVMKRHRPRMSISAYHLPADPEEIPRIVRAAWPDVRTECGPCNYGEWLLRPDVLYFGPNR
ncbi:MAG: FkbM family methyltransferase [Bryobacteraceae bacterium]|nr:FkbM family methyltransferase [Bryobacteraceae bacterium]